METSLQQPEIGLPYDCEPTLNDEQVIEFCRRGFLMLEGVVGNRSNSSPKTGSSTVSSRIRNPQAPFAVCLVETSSSQET